MPTKKKRKPKTREYLEALLDNVGLTDRELAQAIKDGIKSDNAAERAKALELAGQWKGFAEVDKRVGDEIERLPLANVTLTDLKSLCNRCPYCKHKQFDPIYTGKAAPPKEPTMELSNELMKVAGEITGFPRPQGGVIHIPVMGSAVVPGESAGEPPVIFPVLESAGAALENSAMDKLRTDTDLTEAEFNALEEREATDDEDALK